MPIVFVHGVAVRDEDPVLARTVKRLGDVPWPTLAALLREHVAPAISDDPAGVPVMRVYWGDLGARFAWGGRSLVSTPLAETSSAAPNPAAPEETVASRRVRGVITGATALRRRVEDFIPVFIGDVMTYVATRGTAEAPGPIVQRVLAGLEAAAFAKESRGEPLVVLTHSMGGQIVYDLVTHFLPRMPEYRHIRIDYWCAAASQVGLFEELGLFLESSPDRGAAAGATARPPDEHLGGWWNVWDHADLLSFRAGGIVEGVDDSAFFAAGTLATDHFKYLENEGFHRALAEKVRASIEKSPPDGVENRSPRSTEG